MAQLHQELLLELNADSTEFCESPDSANLLAVGTYQLLENRQDRIGKVFLYKCDAPGEHLDLVHTTSTSGVFDMKWTSDSHNTPVLGLALASGKLQILHSVELEEVWSCDIDPDSMLASISWNPHTRMQAAVSTSAGGLAVVQAGEAGAAPLHHWQAHDLEAWAVEFDRHQAHVVYSGGDDSAFKAWDVRQWAAGETTALFTNRKTHAAGVCCITSHPQVEHVVVTGSYDESIRWWDVRNVSRPVCTVEVSTGGGVWRLKWHPRDPTLLLAACMYNGFAIVRCAADSMEVVERYSAHQSIAYGASWFHGQCAAPQQPSDAAAGDGPGEVVCVDRVATCSFYDNRLHLWTPETWSSL